MEEIFLSLAVSNVEGESKDERKIPFISFN